MIPVKFKLQGFPHRLEIPQNQLKIVEYSKIPKTEISFYKENLL